MSAPKSHPSDPRQQVRRYHLEYETLLQRSYLSSIQMEGRCESVENEPPPPTKLTWYPGIELRQDLLLPGDTSCPRLPKMTFQYNTPSTQTLGVAEIAGLWRWPLDRWRLDAATLIDVDRDGLPDLVTHLRGDRPLSSQSLKVFS